MKKKILAIIFILLVTIFVIVLLAMHKNPKGSITGFSKLEVKDIEHVMIQSGKGKFITFDDENSIREIDSYLSNLSLSKKPDQTDSEGWYYRILIKDKASKEYNFDVTFLSENECVIDDIKYVVKNNSSLTLQNIWDRHPKQAY